MGGVSHLFSNSGSILFEGLAILGKPGKRRKSEDGDGC